MAQFRFLLGTLFRLREAERDRHRADFAHVLALEDARKQRAAETDRQLVDLKQSYAKEAAPGPISVQNLMAAKRYEVALQARKQQHLAEQRQMADVIETERLALVDANREVRVLEKLREKQLTEFQQEQTRREIQELDQVAANGWEATG